MNICIDFLAYKVIFEDYDFLAYKVIFEDYEMQVLYSFCL